MSIERGPDPDEARLAAAVARLDALINWERMKRTAATRFSLEPARDLCARLGAPQRSWRAVHVAGSKGKGSTASLIAAGLRAAGISEALYTSPHVVHLRERLRIGGADVAPGPFAEALEAALLAREAGLSAAAPAGEATWFDLVTAAAFVAARGAGVGWMVAECGLGGRLDSTNVIDGEVCVITNIELEHTAVLGSTRALIATEKAGILKPGSTLVTGVAADDEAGRAIDARARELGVRVVRPLEGRWAVASVAERNHALAAAALDELGARGVRGVRPGPGGPGRGGGSGAPLAGSLLAPEVVAGARLPGRLEWFSHQGIPVAIDGGHVPSSVRDVLRDLSSGAPGDPGQPAARGPEGRPVVVLGLARDKDLPGILKAVAALTDRVVCTSVGSDLHFTPHEIAAEAKRLGLGAETAPNPRAALEHAMHLARTTSGGSWVVATGSLYLAGALRAHLSNADPSRRC